ncbi:hypothetical protein DL240_01620 [Lujinxingia litoralis]|uniref:Uncharacterized protein n=2 Tax=Lujinxingia litoralis TaxID=2211119 RepID=A0A328CAT5_9DELT|nr:hypothetical protein DL240_01620 [Lujinxingia litoralis]
MLKQLFKRFRTTGDPARDIDHPHLQAMSEAPPGRSYLDFLLELVRPTLARRLGEYPDSDPVLELAAATLAEMFPERFMPLEGALRDAHTPVHSPPPPPGAGPRSEPPLPPVPGAERVLDEDSDAFETLDESSVVAEAAVEEEAAETFETLDESSVVGEVVLKEESAALESEGTLSVEDDGEAAPAGFVSALDDTAEFEPPPLRGAAAQWPVSLHDPELLHGARVLLAVLLDNDRLPVPQQLSVAELLVAADLWTQLLAQTQGVEQRVEPLARLVEQKFADGNFGQVKLLLRLFPANPETRISNDRQIFYEDMILRMGIHRRQPLQSTTVEELRGGFRGLALDARAKAPQIFEELRTRAGLTMHLYTREPDEVAPWRELARGSELPGGANYLLGLVPPRRWRPVVGRGPRPLQDLLQDHLVKPMARDHLILQLKAAYFVLRAVGDTGLEGYLDDFFNFSRDVCQVEAERLMPEIYRRTLGSAETIGGIFLEMYTRHYQDAIEARMDALDEEARASAFARAMEGIAESDLGAQAPGEFNLGAFVLDAHLGMRFSRPDFGFKLYRLS